MLKKDVGVSSMSTVLSKTPKAAALENYSRPPLLTVSYDTGLTHDDHNGMTRHE